MNSIFQYVAGGMMACWAVLGLAAAEPPHLGATGRTEYGEFLEAANHRAFAIAPGGTWGWVSGEPSVKVAEEQALALCQGQTSQRCVTYAIDERTLFDAAAWPRSWGPYATAGQAKRVVVGRERGRRFNDLAFVDAQGKPRSIAALKGKVIFLHFWGSWCPPCRKEMPDLVKLRRSLADRGDVVFVLLQAREKIETARQWATRQGIDLPLADSGVTGEEDAQFRLTDGGRIGDREISSRFPTTYVIDKHGLVVFSHVGPVADWAQYEAFLRDAAERSGR